MLVVNIYQPIITIKISFAAIFSGRPCRRVYMHQKLHSHYVED